MISAAHPELAKEAEELGVDHYHRLSTRLDHGKTWPKSSRVLPQTFVDKIKALPFIDRLKKRIRGVCDLRHLRHEAASRTGRDLLAISEAASPTDVGSIHRDSWFHKSFNGGYGMFPEGTVTVKVWIPIYCEPGKSGLSIVAGSHLRDWKYHLDTTAHIARPVLDEDPSQVDAKLIPTEAGNLLIFNENVLHGGVVNRGEKTRVSAEITMVLKS